MSLFQLVEILLLKNLKIDAKYKNVEVEIDKIWQLKRKTIPVVVGALGKLEKNTG